MRGDRCSYRGRLQRPISKTCDASARCPDDMLSLSTRVGESLTCGGKYRAEGQESSPRPSAGGGGVLYRVYDLELSPAIAYWPRGRNSFVRNSMERVFVSLLCRSFLLLLSSVCWLFSDCLDPFPRACAGAVSAAIAASATTSLRMRASPALHSQAHKLAAAIVQNRAIMAQP
jgi:hypothetical protein